MLRTVSCVENDDKSNLRDGLVAAHEDFGIVLVKSTLVVPNGWHVLDDDSVVWMLSRLVQNGIGLDHVIHNIGLGDLLGTELLLRAQVLSVIVAQMIVAGNGGELDAGADEEVDESRLHLGLTRLEVITTNVRIMLLGKFNASWDEGVLWRAIDEWSILQNACDGEDS